MKKEIFPERFVIIVAGGSGVRMHSNIPKQFLMLKGIPVLMHSIQTFYNYCKDISIIVVLPKNNISLWDKLCKRHKFSIPHQITIGGKTRFHSVKNGLKLISNDGIVGIHDAARPLVSINTISNCFHSAFINRCAVPCITLNDSARFIDGKNSKPLNRDNIRIIQTPQCFWASELQHAYMVRYSKNFTDDATVFEKSGGKVILVDGNRENIKITTQEDLTIAGILFHDS
jgi:2-C-methyl-D-erythritol 4-phosphate cytidylyltransferase